MVAVQNTPLGPRSEVQHVGLFHARERRRSAEDFDKFAADIASAFDLGMDAAASPLPNPYVMPANARLGISFDEILAAGELTLDIGGSRVLTTPALAADEIYPLDFLHRARTAIPTSAIAGVVSLHVFDEWMRPSVVATGTFT